MPPGDAHRNQKTKNLALLAILVAISALCYGVTMVKWGA